MLLPTLRHEAGACWCSLALLLSTSGQVVPISVKLLLIFHHRSLWNAAANIAA